MLSDQQENSSANVMGILAVLYVFFSFCQTWVTPPPARLDAGGVKEKKSLQVPVCPPPTIAAFNIPPVALRASLQGS